MPIIFIQHLCYLEMNLFEIFLQQIQVIDQLSLNFNELGITFMNIAIGFIMFGIALGIKTKDFTRVLIQPKSILTGFVTQFFLLPALTFLLVISVGFPVSISLGMLLVASCPGGNISNFFTSLAKGNVALSVSLTTISDLFSILMTPLNFTFWAGLYMDSVPLAHPIEISALDVFKTIVLLLGIPIWLGMWVAKVFPNFTRKINNSLKIISIFIFILFIVVALSFNFENFYKYLWIILPIVAIHNLMAFGLGWLAARIMRTSRKDRRTISIEVGIQNSSIALVLIFSHQIFPQGYGGIAFIVAWWGIWHIFAGLIISKLWAGKAELSPKLLPKLNDEKIQLPIFSELIKSKDN